MNRWTNEPNLRWSNEAVDVARWDNEIVLTIFKSLVTLIAKTKAFYFNAKSKFTYFVANTRP